MIRPSHPGGRPRSGHPDTPEAVLSPSPARIRSTLASIVDQPDDLRALRDFHKTLADVNRLRIIRRLAEAPATVTDLIEHVGLSQPLVSWHVGKLRAAGLVETRRNGRETICRLRPESFELFEASERRALGMAPVMGGAGPAATATAASPAVGPVKAAS